MLSLLGAKDNKYASITDRGIRLGLGCMMLLVIQLVSHSL